MANIENFTESWDGHTGEEVLTHVNTHLSNNAASIQTLQQNSVKEITAGYGTTDGVEDKTKIVISGKNAAGDTVSTAEFSTITEATFTQYFNSDDSRETAGTYTPKTIIKYGDSFSIPYDYYVENSSSLRVKGYRSTVTFTISNTSGSKTYTTTTYQSTTSSTLVVGNFVIPSNYFGVGSNTINMSAVTKIGNTQTAAYTTQYVVYTADLKLACTFTGGNYYDPREYNENFTLNFNVTDTKNVAIPSDYTVKKNIYINRILSGNLCSIANGLTGTSLTTNYDELVTSATSFSNVEVENEGAIRLIIKAYIETSDETIESNTVVIQMLNSTGITNNSSNVYISTMLSDVTMNNSTIETYGKQYSTEEYKFYICSAGSNSYFTKIISGSDVLVNTPGTSTADSTTPTLINYTYIYRNTGTFTLSCGDNNSSFDLNHIVSALDTSLNEPTDATLQLFTSGKTSGAEDSTWTSGTTTTTFNGFDWVSNGWQTTDEGTALVINNGASIDINYKLCDSSNYTGSTYPFTISFKYKLKNGNTSEELIKCKESNTGILIKPQYVELSTSTTVSQEISNDDVHEVTFVYYGNSESSGIYKGLQAIFIDGKLQTINSAGTFVSHTNKITITSDYTTIYLYSILAFRKALSFTEIQSIYCFNQSDSSNIASYVNKNNIFNGTTTNIGDYGQSVDRTKIPDGSAVLVLYGREENPTPWLTINSYVKDDAGENKGIRHALKGIRLYIKGDSANTRNFYWVGGSISAQGTSSMAYPIKNFRIYSNKAAASSTGEYSEGSSAGKVTAMYQGTATDPLPYDFEPSGTYTSEQLSDWTKSKFTDGTYGYSLFSSEYGDSYTSAPANRFCLKADYAESSGTHNTGFARFSNYILKESTAISESGITSEKEMSKLPLQYAVSGSDPDWTYDVRANIDGRPIYLFFISPAYTDSDGNSVASKEYYAGRYNMNNDKSNVHVFGFQDVTDYFSNDIVQAEGSYLQTQALTIDPNYSTTHNSMPKYSNGSIVDGETVINPTECWEFTSNDGTPRLIGSFNYDISKAFTEKPSSTEAPYWINGTWEPRYPDIAGEDQEAPYRNGESKPYLLYKLYEFLYTNNYARNASNTVLNNFADNLHLYVNVNSIVKYFVLTHWFLAIDQRIKNSMLSFYCDPYGVTADEASTSPMHYMRGYYIFYDNDTILSLNNSGAIKEPWDFYETDTGTESTNGENYGEFPGNGIHGLWTNLQKCYEFYRDGLNTTTSAYKLGKVVAEAYLEIRAKGTDAIIELYFETNQCDYYPAAIHNVDTEVKYLNPNNLRTTSSALTVPVYLEKAQGTREFQRKNWLKKRTLWLDNLYKASTTDNYVLRYKTADTAGSDNGTIKLTSDSTFRYWRFFASSGSAINKATGFLTSSDTGSITISGANTEKLSQSDYLRLTGLYGVKEIDFTSYNFATAGCGDCATEGEMPFLLTFKLRETTGTDIQSNDDNGPFGWLSLTNMPNLTNLYFCNIKPKSGSTYLPNLNLYDETTNKEFSKLEILDLRGTPISEVVLPKSQSLTSLNLNNPVNLTILNKPNITTINVGTSNLNSLSVSTSSSTVYTWALNAANSIFGKNTKSATITFGKSADEPYTITSANSTQLTLLDSLALKIVNEEADTTYTNINISGYIFTQQEYSDEYIETAFPNLTIVSQMSTDGIKFEWSGDLYEDYVTATFTDNVCSNYSSLGSTFVIKSNMDVANWAIAVDGDTANTLNDRIKIVNSTKTRCWIHADPYDSNSKIDNKDHKLLIYATLSDGTVKNSYEVNNEEIVIYYNPITSLSLTASNVYTTSDTTVTFAFNSNHTKKHLLTKDRVTENSANYLISTTNNATTAFTYDTNDILTGLSVTLTNESDSTITANILNTSANIEIYYNSNLVSDLSALNSSSDKYWILLLTTAAKNDFTIGVSINKELANSIPLMSYWSIVISGLTDVATAQDFTYLKYFQLGSGTDGVFTIPGTAFTYIETPKNTTGVLWTSVASSTDSYNVITFGSTVKKVGIGITLNSVPANLQFDLSNTSITSIGAYGTTLSNFSNNIASIQITLPASAITTMRSGSLFAYPSTLTQLGNIDKAADTIITSGTTLMFNLTDSNSAQLTMSNATLYYPIFSLDGLSVTSGITLGAITSYRSKGSVLSDWTKVYYVNKAFLHNNNVNLSSNVFELSNVKEVQEYAFYRNTSFTNNDDLKLNLLNLNSSVLKIGDHAFERGDYTIVSNSDSSADIAVFNSVTELGANSFYVTNHDLNIQFGSNLTTVGSDCFTNVNDVAINVYLNKSEALTSVQTTSFGNSSSSNVTIYVPADSDLYTQLTASSMECKNRVQTYTF